MTEVDGFVIKRSQVSELSTWLKDFVWMSRELDEVITRQAVMGNPYQPGGKAAEEPLVFDESASDAALDLRGTLIEWAHAVWQSGGPPAPAGMRVPEAAVWLRHNVIRLARHEDADRAYSDIKGTHGRLMRMLDHSSASDDSVIDETKVAEARMIHLNASGIATLAKEMGGPFDNLTRKRVNNMAQNGKFEAVGNWEGIPLYLVGEVLDAHVESRAWECGDAV